MLFVIFGSVLFGICICGGLCFLLSVYLYICNLCSSCFSYLYFLLFVFLLSVSVVVQICFGVNVFFHLLFKCVLVLCIFSLSPFTVIDIFYYQHLLVSILLPTFFLTIIVAINIFVIYTCAVFIYFLINSFGIHMF